MPDVDMSKHRKPDHAVEAILVNRWSPRAMSGQAVDQKQLMSLFEAARWAPSSYNEQPWRFLYAKRDSAHWPMFFGFLVEANQAWCKGAGVLMVILSKKTFARNAKPNSVHTFDAGSAWENLALQGSRMGLVVHGMAGFDKDKARAGLGVPPDFEVEAMVAVGRPGRTEDLPEAMRAGEVPSGRKPVGEIAFEGKFPG